MHRHPEKPSENNPQQLVPNENLASMPEIIISKEVESQLKGQELNQIVIDSKLELKTKLQTLEAEQKKFEVKSEHVSRKNSIDDSSQKPQPQQKKGIITWFSGVFTKDKKEIKPSTEDEENKIVPAKENKDLVKDKKETKLNEDEENKTAIKENKEFTKEKDKRTSILEDEESKLILKEIKDSSQTKDKEIQEERIINDSIKDAQEFVLNEVKAENNDENKGEKIPTSELIEDEEEEENPVEMSICAHLINQKNEEDLTEIFNSNKVNEEQYFKDPIKVLTNPNLMVKIDEHLYEWKIAEPLIIAKLVFHQVENWF